NANPSIRHDIDRQLITWPSQCSSNERRRFSPMMQSPIQFETPSTRTASVVICAFITVAILIVGSNAMAAEDRRLFAGVAFGIATLSADASAMTSSPDISVSLYSPENGPAINTLLGFAVGRYVSVQANYLWNRNDVTLISSVVSPAAVGFYEQRRH